MSVQVVSPHEHQSDTAAGGEPVPRGTIKKEREKSTTERSGIASELRRQAEKRLADRVEREGRHVASRSDANALVHELQVHQIELEMQNEELVRSRADLEVALARYSDLYDFAPVGYFSVDGEGTIRQVNLTGSRLLGVPRSQLLGRRFGAFVAAADTASFNALLAKAYESRIMESCEVALEPAPDAPGSPCYVQITASTSAEGDECRVVVIDVTERKRSEDQLSAWQRMEAIGQLAGAVAHDFNNALAVILSHVEFALENVGAHAPPRADLLEVRGAAERAASLTRQLLAFGRKTVVWPRRIDVNELISRVANMIRRLMGAHIELVLDLAPDLGQVEVDPVQLEQVIVNLAIHAREAMSQGGKLTISTTNVDVDAAHAAQFPASKPGSFVAITVSDTGVGMDTATIGHIFEPFFSTQENERGIDFGLSTVYGSVKQCGGDITVRSEPKRGSTFGVHLPRLAGPTVTSTPRSIAAARPEAQFGGTETILVVEDEPVLRRAVKRILEPVGYIVLTTADGQEALQVCRQYSGTIHLALTDVLMPKMTGPAFAASLKRLRPEARVVFMSGYPDCALDQHGTIEREMYLSKPFNSDTLRRKIREVLDRAHGSGTTRDLAARRP